MDFSALIADLRTIASRYNAKDTDRNVSTAMYCEMFRKILQKAENGVTEYGDQIVILWMTLSQLCNTYQTLTPCPARDSLYEHIFLLCAKVVLNIKWQQLAEDDQGKINFSQTIANTHQHLVNAGFKRFELLAHLMENPWTDPTLSKIMSGDDKDESSGSDTETEETEREKERLLKEKIDEITNYVKKEDPLILKLRVEMLILENCEDFASNLCNCIVRYEPFKEDLDVREMQFTLLHKLNQMDKLQEECEQIVCHTGIKLINRLEQKESNQQLCVRLVQIFLVQDWINPEKNCCTKELLKLWIRHQYMADRDRAKFLENVWSIAKLSSRTEQIGVLVAGLQKECGTKLRQLYTDLCVYAINLDKGSCEKMMLEGDMDGVKEKQKAMSSTCEKLAGIIAMNNLKAAKISALTAFALNPCRTTLYLVEKMYLNKTINQAYERKKDRVHKGKDLRQTHDGEVNLATLYEVERLLNMLRPYYLNPELSWPELYPVCQKFMLEKGTQDWKEQHKEKMSTIKETTKEKVKSTITTSPKEGSLQYYIDDTVQFQPYKQQATSTKPGTSPPRSPWSIPQQSPQKPVVKDTKLIPYGKLQNTAVQSTPVDMSVKKPAKPKTKKDGPKRPRGRPPAKEFDLAKLLEAAKSIPQLQASLEKRAALQKSASTQVTSSNSTVPYVPGLTSHEVQQAMMLQNKNLSRSFSMDQLQSEKQKTASSNLFQQQHKSRSLSVDHQQPTQINSHQLPNSQLMDDQSKTSHQPRIIPIRNTDQLKSPPSLSPFLNTFGNQTSTQNQSTSVAPSSGTQVNPVRRSRQPSKEELQSIVDWLQTGTEDAKFKPAQFVMKPTAAELVSNQKKQSSNPVSLVSFGSTPSQAIQSTKKSTEQLKILPNDYKNFASQVMTKVGRVKPKMTQEEINIARIKEIMRQQTEQVLKERQEKPKTKPSKGFLLIPGSAHAVMQSKIQGDRTKAMNERLKRTATPTTGLPGDQQPVLQTVSHVITSQTPLQETTLSAESSGQTNKYKNFDIHNALQSLSKVLDKSSTVLNQNPALTNKARKVGELQRPERPASAMPNLMSSKSTVATTSQSNLTVQNSGAVLQNQLSPQLPVQSSGYQFLYLGQIKTGKSSESTVPKVNTVASTVVKNTTHVVNSNVLQTIQNTNVQGISPQIISQNMNQLGIGQTVNQQGLLQNVNQQGLLQNVNQQGLLQNVNQQGLLQNVNQQTLFQNVNQSSVQNVNPPLVLQNVNQDIQSITQQQTQLQLAQNVMLQGLNGQTFTMPNMTLQNQVQQNLALQTVQPQTQSFVSTGFTVQQVATQGSVIQTLSPPAMTLQPMISPGLSFSQQTVQNVPMQGITNSTYQTVPMQNTYVQGLNVNGGSLPAVQALNLQDGVSQLVQPVQNFQMPLDTGQQLLPQTNLTQSFNPVSQIFNVTPMGDGCSTMSIGKVQPNTTVTFTNPALLMSTETSAASQNISNQSIINSMSNQQNIITTGLDFVSSNGGMLLGSQTLAGNVITSPNIIGTAGNLSALPNITDTSVGNNRFILPATCTPTIPTVSSVFAVPPAGQTLPSSNSVILPPMDIPLSTTGLKLSSNHPVAILPKAPISSNSKNLIVGPFSLVADSNTSSMTLVNDAAVSTVTTSSFQLGSDTTVTMSTSPSLTFATDMSVPSQATHSVISSEAVISAIQTLANIQNVASTSSIVYTQSQTTESAYISEKNKASSSPSKMFRNKMEIVRQISADELNKHLASDKQSQSQVKDQHLPLSVYKETSIEQQLPLAVSNEMNIKQQLPLGVSKEINIEQQLPLAVPMEMGSSLNYISDSSIVQSIPKQRTENLLPSSITPISSELNIVDIHITTFNQGEQLKENPNIKEITTEAKVHGTGSADQSNETGIKDSTVKKNHDVHLTKALLSNDVQEHFWKTFSQFKDRLSGKAVENTSREEYSDIVETEGHCDIENTDNNNAVLISTPNSESMVKSRESEARNESETVLFPDTKEQRNESESVSLPETKEHIISPEETFAKDETNQMDMETQNINTNLTSDSQSAALDLTNNVPKQSMPMDLSPKELEVTKLSEEAIHEKDDVCQEHETDQPEDNVDNTTEEIRMAETEIKENNVDNSTEEIKMAEAKSKVYDVDNVTEEIKMAETENEETEKFDSVDEGQAEQTASDLFTTDLFETAHLALIQSDKNNTQSHMEEDVDTDLPSTDDNPTVKTDQNDTNLFSRDMKETAEDSKTINKDSEETAEVSQIIDKDSEDSQTIDKDSEDSQTKSKDSEENQSENIALEQTEAEENVTNSHTDTSVNEEEAVDLSKKTTLDLFNNVVEKPPETNKKGIVDYSESSDSEIDLEVEKPVETVHCNERMSESDTLDRESDENKLDVDEDQSNDDGNESPVEPDLIKPSELKKPDVIKSFEQSMQKDTEKVNEDVGEESIDKDSTDWTEVTIDNSASHEQPVLKPEEPVMSNEQEPSTLLIVSSGEEQVKETEVNHLSTSQDVIKESVNSPRKEEGEAENEAMPSVDHGPNRNDLDIELCDVHKPMKINVTVCESGQDEVPHDPMEEKKQENKTYQETDLSKDTLTDNSTTKPAAFDVVNDSSSKTSSNEMGEISDTNVNDLENSVDKEISMDNHDEHDSARDQSDVNTTPQEVKTPTKNDLVENYKKLMEEMLSLSASKNKDTKEQNDHFSADKSFGFDALEDVREGSYSIFADDLSRLTNRFHDGKTSSLPDDWAPGSYKEFHRSLSNEERKLQRSYSDEDLTNINGNSNDFDTCSMISDQEYQNRNLERKMNTLQRQYKGSKHPSLPDYRLHQLIRKGRNISYPALGSSTWKQNKAVLLRYKEWKDKAMDPEPIEAPPVVIKEKPKVDKPKPKVEVFPKCKICLREFDTMKELQTHVVKSCRLDIRKTVMEVKNLDYKTVFKCNNCKAICTSEFQAQIHCEFCKSDVKYNTSYSIETYFVCRLCGETFSYQRKALVHVKETCKKLPSPVKQENVAEKDQKSSMDNKLLDNNKSNIALPSDKMVKSTSSTNDVVQPKTEIVKKQEKDLDSESIKSFSTEDSYVTIAGSETSSLKSSDSRTRLIKPKQSTRLLLKKKIGKRVIKAKKFFGDEFEVSDFVEKQAKKINMKRKFKPGYKPSISPKLKKALHKQKLKSLRNKIKEQTSSKSNQDEKEPHILKIKDFDCSLFSLSNANDFWKLMKSRGRYRCPFKGCRGPYTQKPALMEHLTKCHSFALFTKADQNFRCMYCEHGDDSKDTLLEHSTNHVIDLCVGHLHNLSFKFIFFLSELVDRKRESEKYESLQGAKKSLDFNHQSNEKEIESKIDIEEVRKGKKKDQMDKKQAVKGVQDLKQKDEATIRRSSRRSSAKGAVKDSEVSCKTEAKEQDLNKSITSLKFDKKPKVENSNIPSSRSTRRSVGDNKNQSKSNTQSADSKNKEVSATVVKTRSGIVHNSKTPTEKKESIGQKDSEIKIENLDTPSTRSSRNRHSSRDSNISSHSKTSILDDGKVETTENNAGHQSNSRKRNRSIESNFSKTDEGHHRVTRKRNKSVESNTSKTSSISEPKTLKVEEEMMKCHNTRKRMHSLESKPADESKKSKLNESQEKDKNSDRKAAQSTKKEKHRSPDEILLEDNKDIKNLQPRNRRSLKDSGAVKSEMEKKGSANIKKCETKKENKSGGNNSQNAYLDSFKNFVNISRKGVSNLKAGKSSKLKSKAIINQRKHSQPSKEIKKEKTDSNNHRKEKSDVSNQRIDVIDVVQIKDFRNSNVNNVEVIDLTEDSATQKSKHTTSSSKKPSFLDSFLAHVKIDGSQIETPNNRPPAALKTSVIAKKNRAAKDSEEKGSSRDLKIDTSKSQEKSVITPGENKKCEKEIEDTTAKDQTKLSENVTLKEKKCVKSVEDPKEKSESQLGQEKETVHEKSDLDKSVKECSKDTPKTDHQTSKTDHQSDNNKTSDSVPLTRQKSAKKLKTVQLNGPEVVRRKSGSGKDNEKVKRKSKSNTVKGAKGSSVVEKVSKGTGKTVAESSDKSFQNSFMSYVGCQDQEVDGLKKRKISFDKSKLNRDKSPFKWDMEDDDAESAKKVKKSSQENSSEQRDRSDNSSPERTKNVSPTSCESKDGKIGRDIPQVDFEQHFNRFVSKSTNSSLHNTQAKDESQKLDLNKSSSNCGASEHVVGNSGEKSSTSISSENSNKSEDKSSSVLAMKNKGSVTKQTKSVASNLDNTSLRTITAKHSYKPVSSGSFFKNRVARYNIQSAQSKNRNKMSLSKEKVACKKLIPISSLNVINTQDINKGKSLPCDHYKSEHDFPPSEKSEIKTSASSQHKLVAIEQQPVRHMYHGGKVWQIGHGSVSSTHLTSPADRNNKHISNPVSPDNDSMNVEGKKPSRWKARRSPPKRPQDDGSSEKRPRMT